MTLPRESPYADFSAPLRSTTEFRDYIRAEGGSPESPIPTEKITHIIRRSASGGSSEGLRTFCGIGHGHRVWRISLEGSLVNVNADVWTVCPDCARAAATHIPGILAAQHDEERREAESSIARSVVEAFGQLRRTQAQRAGIPLCEKSLECGSTCFEPINHAGPCMGACDDYREGPGSCPA